MQPASASKGSLPPLLREIFATKRVIKPNGEESELHSNVSQEEANLLYRCVRSLRPERSVEIGFACGISGLAILQALEDAGRGLHTVCDPFQSSYDDIGIANVQRAGLGHRLQFERRYADAVVPGLPRVQFAFIDASHLFDWSLAEFVLIDRKLEVGGVVGFHDLWMPSLQKLLRYILANRSYQLHALTPDNGHFEKPILRLVGNLCRTLPGSRKIFAPEFLNPLPALPNMIFLEKTAEDNRDWRFHASF